MEIQSAFIKVDGPTFYPQAEGECKTLSSPYTSRTIATVNDLNNQHTASCCNFPSMRASRQAMSYSISTLLLRNLSDVFGENDAVRRRAAIDEIFHEDAVFYDPKGGIFRGRDEIDRIAGVIKATHPDFEYQPIFSPEELGDAGRVRWVSGAPGKPPAYAGTDFIVARNGRIASVYLFFDKLP